MVVYLKALPPAGQVCSVSIMATGSSRPPALALQRMKECLHVLLARHRLACLSDVSADDKGTPAGMQRAPQVSPRAVTVQQPVSPPSEMLALSVLHCLAGEGAATLQLEIAIYSVLQASALCRTGGAMIFTAVKRKYCGDDIDGERTEGEQPEGSSKKCHGKDAF
jgi:hypothetical protein